MPKSWSRFRNLERSASEARMGRITIYFANRRMTFEKINVLWNSITWSIGFSRGTLSQANGARVSCKRVHYYSLSLLSSVFFFSFLFLSSAWLTHREDIKTYTVTPLNEECGLIEWVDNLRTLRELVIKLLRERGITPNVWQYLSHNYSKKLGADFFFCSTMRSSTIWTKHAQTFPSFICLQPES